MKCKLCLINDADQTGSHILSCMSVKSMFGERGNEKSFVISANPIESYLKNTKGEEIKEDYILCRPCEQRLAFVESYIAEELFNKIKETNFKNNFPSKECNSIEYIECSRVNPIAFHLFLYSQVWRASIANTKIFKNFQLHPETEEFLRSIINSILPPRNDYRGVTLKYKEWFKQLINQEIQFSKIKYLIATTETIDNKSGDFIMFHPSYDNPYAIMINEWIIYFNLNQNSNEDIFNLLNEINIEELYNYSNRKIKLVHIEKKRWVETRNILRDMLKDQKLKNLRNHMTDVFVKQYGFLPDAMTIDRMILNYLKTIEKDI